MQACIYTKGILDCEWLIWFALRLYKSSHRHDSLLWVTAGTKIESSSSVPLHFSTRCILVGVKNLTNPKFRCRIKFITEKGVGAVEHRRLGWARWHSARLLPLFPFAPLSNFTAEFLARQNSRSFPFIYLPQKPFLSSPPSLRFSFKRFPPLAPPRFYEAKAPVLELDPGPGSEPENPQIVETAAEMPMQEAVFAVVMVSILI